jgi:serine/threonine kinase 32
VLLRLTISFILQFRRQIDHPFVVNLRYAFQDDENCFFVLDLMLGGDLRCSSNLHLLPSFPPIHVVYSPLGPIRFFIRGDRSILYGRALICSMFLAREAHHASVRIASLALVPLYLTLTCVPCRHSNRDIKPDNILLDERGHAHLTDFNIAVHYSDRRLLTGVAGSMAYMAPEILHKRGYTYPIDWWSLGVCAYELIFGRRPFRGRTNTALTLSISKDSLRFPENAGEKCSSAGISFLRGVRLPFWPAPKYRSSSSLPQLLERDAHKRLACSPQGDSLDEIQQHAWFSSINWAALNRKELPSPFVPDVGTLRPWISIPLLTASHI